MLRRHSIFDNNPFISQPDPTIAFIKIVSAQLVVASDSDDAINVFNVNIYYNNGMTAKSLEFNDDDIEAHWKYLLDTDIKRYFPHARRRNVCCVIL